MVVKCYVGSYEQANHTIMVYVFIYMCAQLECEDKTKKNIHTVHILFIMRTSAINFLQD